jgi:hypothetical protein
MIGGGMAFQIGPWLGYALAVIAAAALVWASFEFASADSRLNVVLLVAGGLIGWVVGILLTPSAARDSFPIWGIAVVAFAGGYLVAKFDKIFDLSFRERGDIDAGVVGRLLLFISGIALGLLFTLMWRSAGYGLI